VWTPNPRTSSLSVLIVVSNGRGAPADGLLSGLKLSDGKPKMSDIIFGKKRDESRVSE
jgi:hypothetical protein